MFRRPTACLLTAFLVLSTACVRTLPDQDRRIIAARPDAKLSADILWKDYAADAKAADRRYHGRALVVTGVVTAADKDATPRSVSFLLAGAHGVQANLLDDQAAGILATAEPGQRLTLKCFCEGLDGNVMLKSCIKP